MSDRRPKERPEGPTTRDALVLFAGTICLLVTGCREEPAPPRPKPDAEPPPVVSVTLPETTRPAVVSEVPRQRGRTSVKPRERIGVTGTIRLPPGAKYDGEPVVVYFSSPGAEPKMAIGDGGMALPEQAEDGLVHYQAVLPAPTRPGRYVLWAVQRKPIAAAEVTVTRLSADRRW
ncbi:MAG: hypothetical protein M3552_05890 [Planctomycetota bacterium]|nr:hypothetical protein [Planctomycetota bacterium]